MPRATAPFALCLVFCFACPADDDPSGRQDLTIRDASYSCSDGAGVEWTFSLSVTGDADRDASRVFVETAKTDNPVGYALVEVGRNEPNVEFSSSIAGTPEGQDPQPGEVPFSCAALNDVQVRFCASDFGVSEQSCWLCGDGSAGEAPVGVQGWFSCLVL